MLLRSTFTILNAGKTHSVSVYPRDESRGFTLTHSNKTTEMELNRNKKIEGLLTGSPGPFRIKAIEERGQLVLDQLRETIAREEAEAEFALGKEYWVKYYLEGHSETYGMEIAGNLDKEVKGRRGDYRVVYEGEEMVLEVEKDLKYFFQHGHET